MARHVIFLPKTKAPNFPSSMACHCLECFSRNMESWGFFISGRCSMSSGIIEAQKIEWQQELSDKVIELLFKNIFL
jgi:hypothetical protein